MDDFDIANLMDTEEADFVEVKSPSGAPIKVMNQDEADHYSRISKLYQADNKFSNISDLLELDRILAFEIAVYRWNQWMTQGEDYQGRKVSHTDAQKALDIFSKEVRGLKKDLGIDKATRDKGQGDTVASYLQNLRIRAKEFGIHRNEQAVQAINLLMEIRALVTLYKNSTDEERRIFGARLDDLIDWIEQKGDEFDEIDRQFRAKKQKLWIQEIN